jgi:hypothetical protein
MAENPSTGSEQQFSQLVGRIFSDPNFAAALEQNPEKALKDAGFKLNEQQASALKSAAVQDVDVSDTNVAAFVRPVVSVLTKGTRPVVSVVVSSAVVARTREQER